MITGGCRGDNGDNYKGNENQRVTTFDGKMDKNEVPQETEVRLETSENLKDNKKLSPFETSDNLKDNKNDEREAFVEPEHNLATITECPKCNSKDIISYPNNKIYCRKCRENYTE